MSHKTEQYKGNHLLPEILFITSYPPRECGIATYSQDLKRVLENKFGRSLSIKVCPIESNSESHDYGNENKYLLNVDQPDGFANLAQSINQDDDIHIVMIQHEFGFFEKRNDELLHFLNTIAKPVIVAFHTVLPHPDHLLKENVRTIAGCAESVVVMTHSSRNILISEYEISESKIRVIPHGTHLVPNLPKKVLKQKYHLQRRKVLSTFGLLNSGKSIETTLDALPAVVAADPTVLFLVIGKTHPTVFKKEGEQYRNMLEAKVAALGLEDHVQFLNYFLPLSELLEYLQLTDIYLFTSKDPNQAVSGSFSYAISCGCPVISTPIPHAREVLKDGAGIIFDFENSQQLSATINSLLKNEELRMNIGSNAFHRMTSTAWENAAIAHALLFEEIWDDGIALDYNLPIINLEYIKKLTTRFGIIQFANLNHPDLGSGYTLDDNARAMIAMCQHFELTREVDDLKPITNYLYFIKYCQQHGGLFFNYVDEDKRFTGQNKTTNLEDSNGRAIWALGYFLSLRHLMPEILIQQAERMMDAALLNVREIHSTRAMAFVIKGLYHRYSGSELIQDTPMIIEFANRLVQMFRHESSTDWQWFESYLTYANSVLPEALLCAWLATGDSVYQKIAKVSFDFLLSQTFSNGHFKVISNKSWLHRERLSVPVAAGGEQPIDVAYTILALKRFYDTFGDEAYKQKMEIAFNWFLGQNHLQQIIYNPCTGGCYDGLEENYVNLNQGAESSVSYLLARLAVDPARQGKIAFINKTKVLAKSNTSL